MRFQLLLTVLVVGAVQASVVKRQVPWQPSRTLIRAAAAPGFQQQPNAHYQAQYVQYQPQNNQQQANVVPAQMAQQQTQYRPMQNTNPVYQNVQQPQQVPVQYQPPVQQQQQQVPGSQVANADYERVWNQMSQLWDQMSQRVQTSGLEGDWSSFWTKLTTTLEPYLQQFSQQVSEVMGVAMRQQQQQVVEQGQIVRQLQDNIGKLFHGDQNAQHAVESVLDTFFQSQAQAQQQQQQLNQQPRPTNVGK